MTFIVTLIALLIERFFDWSHLRHWDWYISYQNKIIQKLNQQSSYLILAAIILPLLIAIIIINVVIKGWLYGFISLFFQLFLLIYCLGPNDLWADAFACINALTQGDKASAVEKLRTSFNVAISTDSQKMHAEFLKNIFIAANQRVFAPVFWFIILGPGGALLYRMVVLTATSTPDEAKSADVKHHASTLEAILNWVPVRLFSFIFALGGHFMEVISCWRKKALLGLSSNDLLITESGFAALGLDEVGKIAEDGSIERSAISLLDRSFIILLVIAALAVLLG